MDELRARVARLGWRLDGLVLLGNGAPAEFRTEDALRAWLERQEQAERRKPVATQTEGL
jgi:hypothetical protein